MKIIKYSVENLQNAKLIGTRYTNTDRLNGSFAHKWGEWFMSNRFAALEILPAPPCCPTAYYGGIRTNAGVFEYWIGVLADVSAVVPTGFDSVELDDANYAVCNVLGIESSGELYSQECADLCMAEVVAHGAKCNEAGWFFERYACPDFTAPNENGEVVLHIMLKLV